MVCFCVSLWVLPRVFSSFCITSFGDNTRPQHQETTIRQTSSAIHLSPPQRPVCVVGRLGRKKKRARGARWEGEEKTEAFRRFFAFSVFPSPPARFLFFSIIAIFIDTQRKPLRRREAIHSIELYPVDSVIHVLNNWRLNLIQLACRT